MVNIIVGKPTFLKSSYPECLGFGIIPIDELLPTQDYLVVKTLKKGYSKYTKSPEEWNSLLPIPVVKGLEGKFKILDGHHQVAMGYLHDLPIRAFVIDNPQFEYHPLDYPHIHQEVLESRTQVYKRRYSDAMHYEPRSNCGKPIIHIRDLLQQYGIKKQAA